MNGGLTQREADCLRFIRTYIAANDGVSPSYAQMRDAMGVASNCGISRIVGQLEMKGLISRRPNAARSVFLTDRGEGAVPFDLATYLAGLTDDALAEADLQLAEEQRRRLRQRAMTRELAS